MRFCSAAVEKAVNKSFREAFRASRKAPKPKDFRPAGVGKTDPPVANLREQNFA
jgi:hypothetical protein